MWGWGGGTRDSSALLLSTGTGWRVRGTQGDVVEVVGHDGMVWDTGQGWQDGDMGQWGDSSVWGRGWQWGRGDAVTLVVAVAGMGWQGLVGWGLRTMG